MSLTIAELHQRLQRLENQTLAISHAVRQTNSILCAELDALPESHNLKLRLMAINKSLSHIKAQQ